jgi:hypothetical protein
VAAIQAKRPNTTQATFSCLSVLFLLFQFIGSWRLLLIPDVLCFCDASWHSEETARFFTVCAPYRTQMCVTGRSQTLHSAHAVYICVM